MIAQIGYLFVVFLQLLQLVGQSLFLAPMLLDFLGKLYTVQMDLEEGSELMFEQLD